MAHALESVLDDLKALFEAEKSLLTSGRAKDAAGLIEPKREAMAEFEQVLAQSAANENIAPYRSQIEQVVSMGMENAILLQAVRNGVNSIVARLRGLDTAAYVGSYNMQGRAMPFSQATGSYVKKV